jgi:hypothetical protein
MRLRAHLEKSRRYLRDFVSRSGAFEFFSYNMAPRQLVISAGRLRHRCALETFDNDV